MLGCFPPSDTPRETAHCGACLGQSNVTHASLSGSAESQGDDGIQEPFNAATLASKSLSCPGSCLVRELYPHLYCSQNRKSVTTGDRGCICSDRPPAATCNTAHLSQISRLSIHLFQHPGASPRTLLNLLNLLLCTQGLRDKSVWESEAGGRHQTPSGWSTAQETRKAHRVPQCHHQGALTSTSFLFCLADAYLPDSKLLLIPRCYYPVLVASFHVCNLSHFSATTASELNKCSTSQSEKLRPQRI